MTAAGAGRALFMALAGLALWGPPAYAQDPAADPDPPALRLPTSLVHLDFSAPAPGAGAAPALDIETRFQEFQVGFEREFGTPRGGGRPAPSPGEAFALRMKERIEARFAESAVFRWYEGAERVYQRFEGIYERIEDSTRWAGKGFEVNTHMESVVDGRMRVEVEREVRGFRIAFDMRDAAEGRFGLRAGGTVRGYKISVDVSDLAAGTLRLQLDKRFD